MDDSKWARYAALGGVVFVVLNVVGAILAGSPPAADESATKIADYFADNGDGVKAALWLGGLGSVGLVWWFGSLWRRMSRAEGGQHRLAIVSLLGLGLGGALFMASASVSSAAAFRLTELGEGTQVFYTLSVVLLSAAGFGVGIHLIATSALSFRAKMLPAWLAWLGALAGLAFLISAVIGSASESSATFVFGFIGFIGWSVWILGISYVMWSEAPNPTA